MLWFLGFILLLVLPLGITALGILSSAPESIGVVSVVVNLLVTGLAELVTALTLRRTIVDQLTAGRGVWPFLIVFLVCLGLVPVLAPWLGGRVTWWFVPIHVAPFSMYVLAVERINKGPVDSAVTAGEGDNASETPNAGKR